jgi:hypothetical protein
MKRNGLLALLVLFGLMATALEAQPSRRPYPPTTGIEGRWYNAGDPRQPCYIEVLPGGFRGPRLLFTNERGEPSEGRFLSDGSRVIAYDWAGGLMAYLRGDTIEWQNGTIWTR